MILNSPPGFERWWILHPQSLSRKAIDNQQAINWFAKVKDYSRFSRSYFGRKKANLFWLCRPTFDYGVWNRVICGGKDTRSCKYFLVWMEAWSKNMKQIHFTFFWSLGQSRTDRHFEEEKPKPKLIKFDHWKNVLRATQCQINYLKFLKLNWFFTSTYECLLFLT